MPRLQGQELKLTPEKKGELDKEETREERRKKDQRERKTNQKSEQKNVKEHVFHVHIYADRTGIVHVRRSAKQQRVYVLCVLLLFLNLNLSLANLSSLFLSTFRVLVEVSQSQTCLEILAFFCAFFTERLKRQLGNRQPKPEDLARVLLYYLENLDQSSVTKNRSKQKSKKKTEQKPKALGSEEEEQNRERQPKKPTRRERKTEKRVSS